LTDYVATRWYRAPEILLSSTRYTKGVDAWSVGAILGEMLLSQPLFPGKSTVHQLELVLEVTGRPNKLDMKAIKSKHTATMLESIAVKPQRSLQSMFPTAPADALDLLGKLLVFNPDRRLSIEDAIRHPYLSQFHNPADEPTLNAPIHISIDDNKRYKISEYRKYLYRKIVERKKQLRAKRAEAQARAAAAAGGGGGGGDMAQYAQHSASAQRPTGSGTGARPAPGASSNAAGYVVPQGASQNFYAQQQYSQHPQQQQQQQQQYPRAGSSGYQQQQLQRTAGGGGSAGGHHYNVPPNVAAQNQLTSSSAYGGGAAAAAAGARKPGMR
jgi:mitogen-activated protein kinase 15